MTRDASFGYAGVHLPPDPPTLSMASHSTLVATRQPCAYASNSKGVAI